MKKTKNDWLFRQYSLIFLSSHGLGKKHKFLITENHLRNLLCAFLMISIFSVGSLLVSGKLTKELSYYQKVISLNNDQKRTIYSLLQENKQLQATAELLRNQDSRLRKKLFLVEKNNKEVPRHAPQIKLTTQDNLKGQLAEVYINGVSVFSFFDNSFNPNAIKRAQSLEQNIFKLYQDQSPFTRLTYRNDSQNIYRVFYGKDEVFAVTPEDASYYGMTPRKLAGKWINDLSKVLGLETEPIFISQMKSFFDRVKTKDLNSPLFTKIEFVEPRKVGEELTLEPQVHKVDQLVSFLTEELTKRKDSYNSLRNVIKEYKARFAQTPSIKPVSTVVISNFGRRRHPITGLIKFHTGIDLPAPMGAPVRATADGEVVRLGWLGGYGLAVEIYHGYGISTLYAHNSAFAVSNIGQKVKKGQIISYVGRTGLSLGPHSHYEVRVWNYPQNPVNYLDLDIFTASRNW
jgi:murein DD-endopeptidase MepM/ murein hydrolase activator NlpD